MLTAAVAPRLSVPHVNVNSLDVVVYLPPYC